MLAGRPHEAVGNGSPRWMTAAPRKRAHRTRPTGRLTPHASSELRRYGPHHERAHKARTSRWRAVAVARAAFGGKPKQDALRTRGSPVDVPVAWTGPSGHLLHEPWMQPWFRDGLAVLITELEAAAPAGLGDRRTAFRQQGQQPVASGASSPDPASDARPAPQLRGTRGTSTSLVASRARPGNQPLPLHLMHPRPGDECSHGRQLARQPRGTPTGRRAADVAATHRSPRPADAPGLDLRHGWADPYP